MILAFLATHLFANFFIFSLVHLYKRLQNDPQNYHNMAFVCAFCLCLFAFSALYFGIKLFS